MRQTSAVVHQYSVAKFLLDKINFKDKIVLDLACGKGNISKEIAQLAHEVIGVDISREKIRNAKANFSNRNIQYLVMDAAELNFEDNYFDIVFCNFSFQHFTEKQKAINECYRVLKPKGVLHIATPLKGFQSEPLRAEKQVLRELNLVKNTKSRAGKVSREDMLKFAEKAGFSKIRSIVKNNTYYFKNLKDLLVKYESRSDIEINKIRQILEPQKTIKGYKETWKILYLSAIK